VLRDEI